MYDIKMLEEEWKRYNRKRYRPWIWALSIMILFGIAIGYLWYAKVPLTNMLPEKSAPSVKKVKTTNTAKRTIVLDGPISVLESKPLSPAEADVPLVEVSMEESIEKPSETVEKKRLEIQVVEANDPSTFKAIEKRFRLGHDIDDSLFLARSYYDKRQYKKAEYWALQTNKIDDNIEESWLIFVKAKLKRGQKNEALRVLNAYIKRTHSPEAKALLEKVKKGIF